MLESDSIFATDKIRRQLVLHRSFKKCRVSKNTYKHNTHTAHGETASAAY